MSGITASGGCLCGGVRYEVHGPLRDVFACHCSQCRRTSGNFVAATRALGADIIFVTQDTLAWFASSADAERGFCNRCGANLFWRRKTGRHVSIMAGTLDPPTGLKLMLHMFVADKSDFYDIEGNTPRHAALPD